MLNEKDSPWITGEELAKLCGVSGAAISRAKKAGRIKTNHENRFHKVDAYNSFLESRSKAAPEGVDETAPEAGLDLSKPPDAETLATLDKTIKDFEAGKAPPENGKFTYTAARAIREAIIAKEAWIRLQKAEATIISKTDAINQIQVICKHNRDAWLNWPQVVAIEMAEQLGVESGVLHDLLLKAVKDHLATVATLDIPLPGNGEPLAPEAPAEESIPDSLAFDFSETEEDLGFEDDEHGTD